MIELGQIKLKENICSVGGVASIEDKMIENYLHWFDHLRRKPMYTLVKRVKKLDKNIKKIAKKIDIKKLKRPKITYIDR